VAGVPGRTYNLTGFAFMQPFYANALPMSKPRAA
jgi:hypothetical protein